MPEKRPQIVIEGAELLYRNFSGKERGRFNPEGQRNFCVYLDEETAKQMAIDGWNVKIDEGKEEGDPDRPYIQVSVGFDRVPPRIIMLSSNGNRTLITEETVAVLDMIDIENCDLIAHASRWYQGDGKTGLKAWLKTMYITPEENVLDRKYAVEEEGE